MKVAVLSVAKNPRYMPPSRHARERIQISSRGSYGYDNMSGFFAGSGAILRVGIIMAGRRFENVSQFRPSSIDPRNR